MGAYRDNIFTNPLPTLYQPFTNPLPTLYQPFTNFLPTLYQPFTNMKQSHIIINEITHELRMTIPELADNIGVSQSSIYAIAQGKTKRISPTLAGRIIDKYPQFSRRYLLTGEGSIYTDPAIDTSQLSPDVLAIIAKKDEQIDRLLSIIEAMQR